MPWWEVFGWLGSFLVVASLMVPSVRRFRILNLTGSLIATAYNVVFEIWPYAAMNGAIVLINVYWLWRLHRESAQSGRGYEVTPVAHDDALLAQFVTRHGADIRASYPRFDAASLRDARTLVTTHGDELVGVFATKPSGPGTATVLVDYVTTRFRDLGPGRHLYSRSELFAADGVTRLTVDDGATTDPGYFRKLGFTDDAGVLSKELRPAL